MLKLLPPTPPIIFGRGLSCKQPIGPSEPVRGDHHSRAGVDDKQGYSAGQLLAYEARRHFLNRLYWRRGGTAMSAFPSISVRQPQPFDLVDDPVEVCGVGTGFEGQFSARIRDANGAQLVLVAIH